MRIKKLLTVSAAFAVVAVAGSTGAAHAADPQMPSEWPPLSDKPTFAAGTFGAYEEGRTATTYDTELVPAGASAAVFSASGGFGVQQPASWPGVRRGGTFTALGVDGLVPNREYGAHVHTQPCGPTGDDAGPHFQYFQAPNPPSTDPRYANPRNEIWLDFTTDENGQGFATSRVHWTFPENRRPASVVIHEHHTSTAPGEAGEAGARLACVNVDF